VRSRLLCLACRLNVRPLFDDERAGAGASPLLPSSGAGVGARVARQQSPILPTGKAKLRATEPARQRFIFGPQGEKTLPAAIPTFRQTTLVSASSLTSLDGGGGCCPC
jgi:hypothetical protein